MTVDLRKRGRKAIVNGGSAGPARGTALALAGKGVDLFVSVRGQERLVKTCDEIRRITGAPVTPIVADHATLEGRTRILASIHRRLQEPC